MGFTIENDSYFDINRLTLKTEMIIYDNNVIERIKNNYKDLLYMSNQDILKALFDYIEKKKIDDVINFKPSDLISKANVKIVDQLPYRFESDPNTIYVNKSDDKIYMLKEDKSDWIDVETGEEKEANEKKIRKSNTLNKLESDILASVLNSYCYDLKEIKVVEELPDIDKADKFSLYIKLLKTGDYTCNVAIGKSYRKLSIFAASDLYDYVELYKEINGIKSEEQPEEKSTKEQLKDLEKKILDIINIINDFRTGDFRTIITLNELPKADSIIAIGVLYILKGKFDCIPYRVGKDGLEEFSIPPHCASTINNLFKDYINLEEKMYRKIKNIKERSLETEIKSIDAIIPDSNILTDVTATTTAPDPRDTEISDLKDRLDKLENRVSENEESNKEFSIIDNIITW